MKNDPNDFEAVRKLMALKRHEAPPPGYFSRLPGTIIARIERGEGKAGFWERITADFAVRPAFAYAFVLAACGALTTAFIRSGHNTQKPPVNPAGRRLGSISFAEAYASGYDPAEPLHVANWLGNTNPASPAPECRHCSPRQPGRPASFQINN